MRVVTASSDEYRPLADITEKTKADYCNRHGYELVLEHHSPNRIAWERVEFWIKNLPGSEWMWASGTDVGVTGPDHSLTTLINNNPDHDLLICCDGNGLQADSFVMRDCEACRDFLSNVMACENKVAHEQDSMHIMLANFTDVKQSAAKPLGSGWYCTDQQHAILQNELNASPVRVKVVSQRLLNAYPVEYYGGNPASHPLAWHAGDFAAHMVATSIPIRVVAFKQMLGL